MKLRSNRIKPIFWIFAAVAILLIIVGLIFAVPTFAENAKKQKILSSGVETVATVTGFEAGGITVNNVEYYFLTYEFVGNNGAVIEGETAATYTEIEAAQAVMDRALTIFYNEEGSVEKGFDRGLADTRPRIFLLTFGLLGVAFAAIGAGGLLFSRRGDASIDRDGETTDGTVVGKNGGTFIVGKEYFSIKVRFTNARGEETVGSTGYKYTANEAEAFSEGDIVGVKYYGKSVLILGKKE